MNWKKAIISFFILFILSVSTVTGFNVFMRRQMNIWGRTNMELGIFPKGMVLVHNGFTKYILFVIPVLFVICLVFSLCISRKENK